MQWYVLIWFVLVQYVCSDDNECVVYETEASLFGRQCQPFPVFALLAIDPGGQHRVTKSNFCSSSSYTVL